jgi:hypothetical protein
MSLRADRTTFTTLKSKLIIWINEELTYGDMKVTCFEAEGFVYLQRHVKVGTENVIARDAVHIPNGRHYEGLAVDLCVFVGDTYITSGDHPIWKVIDAKALSLHPKLSLGLEFHDANHLSWAEGDQK